MATVEEEAVEDTAAVHESRATSNDVGEQITSEHRPLKYHAHVRMFEYGNSPISSILMCCIGREDVIGAEDEVDGDPNPNPNKKVTVIVNESQLTSHRGAGQGTSEQRPMKYHAYVRMFEYGNSHILSILMCCIGREDVIGAEDEVDGDPNPNKKVTVIVNESQLTSHRGAEQGTSEQRPLTCDAHVPIVRIWELTSSHP